MKAIKLTQGKFALVDDQDYDWLMQWKWFAVKARNGNFYASRTSRLNGRQMQIRMHRQIMGLVKTEDHGDHIDRNTPNNQRHNLRKATAQENQRNTVARGGTSKYKGVSFHRMSKKWLAQIAHNNKTMYLGVYHSQEQAALAYNSAAIKYHGEFARINEL